MEISLVSRLKHSWNAFMNTRDPTADFYDTGASYSYRPDRTRLTRGNERSITNAIYNRISLDVASLTFSHCRVDENDRYVETINSPLDQCLKLEANLDQTGRAFMQDVVMSLLDEGVVAIVPTDTNIDPTSSTSFDILSMRTGKILEWKPKTVKVRLYNENKGIQEDIWCDKRHIGIVENPFYSVMNESNSTLQRLVRKLSILDAVDEQSGSGKLDMIIQLPYVIKSETRRKEAERRRADLEKQLNNSKYGIGYTDSTERIVQLNRPIDNNLLKQIEYLTDLLFSQLSITKSILDGTASEQEMLNYHSGAIEPIASAIVDEMKRKFLTKTARTQKQTIKFFKDPFKLVTVKTIADVAGVLVMQEIITANEVRPLLGMKPSSEPKADQLTNSNINQTGPGAAVSGESIGTDPSVNSTEQPSLGEVPVSDL